MGWDESEQSEFKPRGPVSRKTRVSPGCGAGPRAWVLLGAVSVGYRPVLPSVPHSPHPHGGQATSPLFLADFD